MFGRSIEVLMNKYKISFSKLLMMENFNLLVLKIS